MAFLVPLMVFVSTILVGCTADHKPCRSVRSIGDRILRGHLIKTTTGKSFERCTIECEKESECFSTNYLTVTATCQMNNTTAKWFPADFVPSPGALYMDSLVREYDPNPCNDRTPPCDGQCVHVPGQLRAVCVCLKTPVSSCQPDACKPAALGMESGVIKLDQITSSSTSVSNSNNMSRLNYNAGSWTPNTDDQLQWLQVSFVSQTKVFTQIATQGNGVSWWWVTRYAIDFKTGASHWQSYSEDGGNTIKIFMGNTDHTSIAKNTFTKPLVADIIKIKPLNYSGRIALRIELYGCNLD